MYIHVHVLPRGHRSSLHKIGQYRRGSGYTPAHQRKAKLQYYVGAVSQVSHVPGQMTLEMHQDARRCVKCGGHYIWRSQAADKRPGYGQMLPLRVSSIAYQHRREHSEAREDPQRLFSVVVCRSVAR
jgi:hypothetical protein